MIQEVVQWLSQYAHVHWLIRVLFPPVGLLVSGVRTQESKVVRSKYQFTQQVPASSSVCAAASLFLHTTSQNLCSTCNQAGPFKDPLFRSIAVTDISATQRTKVLLACMSLGLFHDMPNFSLMHAIMVNQTCVVCATGLNRKSPTTSIISLMYAASNLESCFA